MTLKHKKQLVDVDMKLVKQLDQKVRELQNLQKHTIPVAPVFTKYNQ